jgi:enterochelin esterase-like enzyme
MWTEADIGGHLCDIFEPSTPHPENLLLIYLHGVHLQRLVDQATFIELFQRHGLRVVAPMTQRSWWTDRICEAFDRTVTPEGYVLDQVLPWIDERWGIAPPQIGLLGTSMGGQGALRFSYKHPNIFPVVAGISPAIDYQSRFTEGDESLRQMYRTEEDARQDTALLHIHPLNWPRHQFFCCDPADERWWDSADRLAMKLYSLGVAHELDLETTGGGHSFEYYNRIADRAIQFLVTRLEQERRRLPVV